MRPSGPLPPQVYWVRRAATLAVIVVVTALIWWLVSGAGDANETTASDVGQSPSAPSPAMVDTTTEPTTSSEPVARPRTPAPTTQVPSATGSPRPTSGPTPEPEPEPRKPPPPPPPLAEPTGDCDPTGVDIAIDVADAKAGQSNTATFVLTSVDTPACTLSVTPATVVINVTSGDDTVWSSDDCPDALLAKQIVVRSDPPSSYEFTWNGRRSSEGCQLYDTLPEPGGYWVEAALIGGEPHEAYFDIT